MPGELYGKVCSYSVAKFIYWNLSPPLDEQRALITISKCLTLLPVGCSFISEELATLEVREKAMEAGIRLAEKTEVREGKAARSKGVE